MNRQKRLRPLVRIVERRVQDAANALRISRRELAERKGQLEMLRSYRAQYVQGLIERGQQGLGALPARDYMRFLTRLDEAIGATRTQVAAAEKSCQEMEGKWQSSRARTKALGTVMARYQTEARRMSRRAEQRLLDEHAQRDRVGDGGRDGTVQP